MTMELARYEADGKEIAITDDDIRYVLAQNQNVTNEEIKLFIELCVAHKLNPFIKEAYIIKYGTQAATLVIGKDVWVKRAMRDPRYMGHQAGLTFLDIDGRIRRREGSMLMSGEKLIGAWARVHLKGYQVPLYDEVSYDEYVGRKKDGSVSKQWVKMPGTMLRKVALVHVLREAFPEEFGGCYDAAEMGVDAPEYESDNEIKLGSDAVQIVSDEGVTRIPVFEDDAQRMAYVEEVARRDVYPETPNDYGAGADYQGWEAF